MKGRGCSRSPLQPPTANPRSSFGADTLEGLAESIKADGLLQNLVIAPGAGKARSYRIISGERRYRALKLLAERGDIAADHPVPVEIRAGLSKNDVLRLATVENMQRQNLPPLDESEALAKLVRKGTTLDDLTARTGLSATTIKRRLALNTLCDQAQASLRDGTINLAQAEALTLGPPEAQELALHEIEQGFPVSAEDIRRHFLDDKPSVAMAIFRPEQYNGTITTDLFGTADESYFDDAGQFMALQRAAVERLAEEHRGTAAWVEVTEHYRIQDWQYDKAGKRNRKGAGVLINLAPSGAVEVREGLIKPKAIDADTAAATADSPLAPAKSKPFYAAPLRRYIGWHKSLAVQELLLADPRKTKEVADSPYELAVPVT